MAGNNPTLYGCVSDPLIEFDPFGLLKIALNLKDYLDEFAKSIGGENWKQWVRRNESNWKSILLDLAGTPGNSVHFNLDGIDNPWTVATRGASGIGGATDWELFQLKMDANDPLWDVTFYEKGEIVDNPFKCK